MWRQCCYLINPPLPTDHISVTPKQSLSTQSCRCLACQTSLSGRRLSTTDRQTDRQTNMSPLARFSQAVTNSAMEWHCLVWTDYPFNQASYLKNGSILQKQRAHSHHEETFNISAGINRNTNVDWNRQFHCCSCLKTQWGPGCKDSGASGFGPDRPQRG